MNDQWIFKCIYQMYMCILLTINISYESLVEESSYTDKTAFLGKHLLFSISLFIDILVPILITIHLDVL